MPEGARNQRNPGREAEGADRSERTPGREAEGAHRNERNPGPTTQTWAGGTRPGDGRVALVTGASRGIGRAVALRLARDGFAVACCARDAARIDGVVDEVRAAGGRASGFVMDVTDPLAVSSVTVAIAAE